MNTDAYKQSHSGYKRMQVLLDVCMYYCVCMYVMYSGCVYVHECMYVRTCVCMYVCMYNICMNRQPLSLHLSHSYNMYQYVLWGCVCVCV